MGDASVKVRFIKFVEEIHVGDKVTIKKGCILTSNKFTLVETLWNIMHKNEI